MAAVLVVNTVTRSWLMVHVDWHPGLLLPQTLIVVSSPGYRASERGDREMGEGAVLGGLAGGFRGLIFAVLVQSLLKPELQEEPNRARHRPTGRDHWGGRHNDPTGVALLEHTVFSVRAFWITWSGPKCFIHILLPITVVKKRPGCRWRVEREGPFKLKLHRKELGP